MRVPRVRSTARRMMIAVAAVGGALGAYRLYGRWAYCQERALYFAERERMVRGLVLQADLVVRETKAQGFAEAAVDQAERDAAAVRAQAETAGLELSRLRRAYERASWRPWLPANPLPP